MASLTQQTFGNFDKGLRRWVDDNRYGLIWMGDPRVMTIKYEDLVKRYDETMSRICEFVGEKFEEAPSQNRRFPGQAVQYLIQDVVFGRFAMRKLLKIYFFFFSLLALLRMSTL